MYNRKEIRVISSAKPKQNPFAKDVVVDQEGQWANFGQVVKIPSDTIDTNGMPGDIIGFPDVGQPRVMPPNGKFKFPNAKMVTEVPMFDDGGAYQDMYLTDEEIEEYKRGGCVVKELPKFQEAGETNLNTEPTTKDRWKATMTYLDRNPYEDMPKWDQLNPVKTKNYPKMAGDRVFVPHASVYADPYDEENEGKGYQYQKVEMPDDYIGLDVYTINGKPMVLDKDFNEEYLTTYKDKKLLGKDPIYHVYGRGMPYNPALEELYKETHPDLFPQEPLASNKRGGSTDDGYIEIELDDDQIKAYRDGGFVVEDLPKAQDGIKPRISYTAEQLKEYEDAYTGEEPFMDRFKRESDEMGYFTVTDEQGNVRSYDPSVIHDEIMQHGARSKKLAEMTGGTEEEIKKYFQPSFDYHQASYDVRGRKMLDELIDKGMSKEEAFDELINKKKFGTKEGLERVFSQSYDDLVQYKDYQKKKAQYDKLNAAQQRAEQYSHLTDEQLLAESKKQSGPTVEGANYLAELDRREFIANQPTQQPLRTLTTPVVSDNTRVDTQARDLKIEDIQNRMDYNRRGFNLDGYSPEQEQAAYQKYVLQQRAYNDIGIDIENFVTADGEYDYEALAHAMANPDNATALNKNFKQQEQIRYDAAPWYQRYASNVSAFLDDPINVGANLLSGEGPMLNQSKMRNDPEYLQQVANQYGLDPATVKAQWDNGIIDDIFDYVNPGHWGTAAGKNITDASKEFDKGNYWEGVKDYGTAFLNVAPAVPAARIMRGVKPLPDAVTKIPQYAERVMSANPSKYVGDWAKNMNLNTALAATSATNLPSALQNVYEDPSLATFGELGLTTLGILPGAGLAKQVSPYVKSAPRGIKSVVSRQAPLSDLFKRTDLARFSTTEKLAEMQRKLAAGDVLDPSDYAWYTSLQHSKDALKYANPSASLRMNIHGMSTAAAQDFKLMNQAKKISKMNKGLSEAEIKAEDALFKSFQDKMKKGTKLSTSEQKKYDALFPKKQIEDAISKSIPSKAEMMADKNFLEFYKSQPLNTRINMNEMFASPQDYWQHQIYMNNPQLESVMRSQKIFSPQEYIVGRASADKFKPVSFSPEGLPTPGSSLSSFTPFGLGAVGLESIFDEPRNFNTVGRYRFQDGGGTTMELDDDEIAEMKAKGFMVVEDDENIPNLHLPQMGFGQRNINPFSFVDSFPMGDDMNGLLVGAGANFMFDTPLKNLRAGFDLTATNLTGIQKGKPVFNEFKVNPPSVKVHYTLPNKKR